jgi:hypothetical protein
METQTFVFKCVFVRAAAKRNKKLPVKRQKRELH